MVLSQVDVTGAFRPQDGGTYPDSGSTWYYFGTNTSVETFEASNNAQRVQTLGSRNAIDVVEQNFEGSFSVSFDLVFDPDSAGPTGIEWLDALDATLSDEDSDIDGADDYNFDEIGWFDLAVDMDGSDVRLATGCVATSLSVDFTTDERATVSLDGFYTDEDTTGTATVNPTRPDDTEPTTFDEISLSYGTAKLNCPQSVTIDAENNVAQFRCLDTSSDGSGQSRTTQALGTGNFNPSVSITDLIDFSNNGITALDRALGGSQSSVDDGTLDADENLTISVYDNRQGTEILRFNLDAMLTDTYSNSGITPDAEAVEQEISETATTLTVVPTPDAV